MKSFLQYIFESSIKTKVANFFRIFSTNFKTANNLRFLSNKSDREEILSLFESLDKCNKKLYRSTYLDYSNIQYANINETYYEPLISTTSDLNICNSFIYKDANTDELNNASNKAQQMRLIINPGSKSLDIDNYSEYKGQKEYIACGKFKLLSKELKNERYKAWDGKMHDCKILECVVEQVFDEDLNTIFNKLKPLHDELNAEKINISDGEISAKPTDEQIVDAYNKFKKKTIQGTEQQRLIKKGITIDDKYLSPLLSKRIFNNVIAELNSPITYKEFFDVVKKYNLKIYGGKKFGYNEIDFSKNI